MRSVFLGDGYLGNGPIGAWEHGRTAAVLMAWIVVGLVVWKGDSDGWAVRPHRSGLHGVAAFGPGVPFDGGEGAQGQEHQPLTSFAGICAASLH